MSEHFASFRFTKELRLLASKFDCGSNVVYNTFLRSDNALDDFFGKTYVIITRELNFIAGYYNISTGDVEYNDGFQTLKCGGSIHINYLALDKRFRGKALSTNDGNIDVYWSDILLRDCIKRVEEIRRLHVGLGFITLTSSTEGYKLYRRHNFMDADDDGLAFSLNDSEKSGEGKRMYYPLDIE